MAGRPKLPDNRVRKGRNLRLNDLEFIRAKQAAKKLKVPLSNFMRDSVNERADRVISEPAADT